MKTWSVGFVPEVDDGEPVDELDDTGGEVVLAGGTVEEPVVGAGAVAVPELEVDGTDALGAACAWALSGGAVYCWWNGFLL